MEDCNEPLYFQEFNSRAESHGLQYLWESKGSALARSLPEEELRVLDSLSDDLIRREQYFDFCAEESSAGRFCAGKSTR